MHIFHVEIFYVYIRYSYIFYLYVSMSLCALCITVHMYLQINVLLHVCFMYRDVSTVEQSEEKGDKQKIEELTAELGILYIHVYIYVYIYMHVHV